MAEKPNGALMRAPVSEKLEENLHAMRVLFHVPPNTDVVFRPLTACGTEGCLVYMDGMAGLHTLDQFVLGPLLGAQGSYAGEELLDTLIGGVLAINDVQRAGWLSEVVRAVLDGRSALLLAGCKEAILMETRGYERRAVSTPVNETVIMGPHEGFVENLRTNITLLRRIVRSEMLVTEIFSLGSELPTNVALIYLSGVARPELVERMKKRIQSLNVTHCPGSGFLMQLIEDNPYALMPQILQTERPDRATSFLTEGQILVMVDGSPYALSAPITLFHVLHASDDSFMRWQYGSFMRVSRTIGLLLSLFLPGMYIALISFHSHMIPLNLLTSIAESRALVPFPVIVEIFIMEISLYLINEAGTRVPSQVGAVLSIVGALILGQAAVAASVISPILIIVVALTGIGNFTLPQYAAGFGTQILRLIIIVASATLGIYGIILAAFLLLCHLGSMTSLGEPYLAPVAPYRPHNPDILMRLPLWMQRRRMFYAQKDNWLEKDRKKPMRGWRGGGR